MQLLMGASDFCGLMHALALLAPGVDGKRFPTVAAYGRFGGALLTSPPGDDSSSRDAEKEDELMERGWQVSPPKGKKGKVGACATGNLFHSLSLHIACSLHTWCLYGVWSILL